MNENKKQFNLHASYRYYLHGPLDRMELGDHKVQGVDYAYTLQGWLKGINGNEARSFQNTAADMAGDGASGSIYAPFPRDVYGISLGYYDEDYSPIGGDDAEAFPLKYNAPNTLANTGNELFNGNISNSTITLSGLENGLPIGYSYGYDQLNRLLHTRWNRFYNGQITWNNGNILAPYQEDVAYDANGNILQYFRNANWNAGHLEMDSLTYYYNGKTNQLNYIRDNIAAANYTTDLDNQSIGNYAYDSIGNLIQVAADGVSDMQWTVYGKLKQAVGTGFTQSYTYDANNNRIIKIGQLGPITGKQYFIRDAQGNVLATYTYDGSTLKWTEQDLYGSSRVGLWSWNKTIPTQTMLPQNETDTLSDWYLLGGRYYELTNHLGNVLSVITDKKIGVSLDDATVDHYSAEVLSQNDYYPFGMLQPGRSFRTIPYPYLFNGKRMENVELFITNIYDYGMRSYDARVGRFYSVDPLASKYPELSPYQFASNTPIRAIDLNGLESFNINFGKAQLWKSLGITNSKQIEYDVSQGFKKAGTISKDILIVGGGVISVLATGGANAPVVVAALSYTSASVAIGGGGAKIYFDLKDKNEISDKIPTSVAGVVNLGISWKYGKNKYTTIVAATLEIAEGIVTANLRNPEELIKNYKGALKGIKQDVFEASDKTITITNIVINLKNMKIDENHNLLIPIKSKKDAPSSNIKITLNPHTEKKDNTRVVSQPYIELLKDKEN